MSSATESESDERYRKRYRSCGGYLMMTPRERRWRIYVHCDLVELKNVHRWFVKEFPPVIRERVMTFVDKCTAQPILEVELEINHPELAKALKRPTVGRIPGQDFPSYYDTCFQAHLGR